MLVPVDRSLARRVPPLLRGLALRRELEIDADAHCPYIGPALVERFARGESNLDDLARDHGVQQARNAAEHSRFTLAERQHALAGAGLDIPLPAGAHILHHRDLEAALFREHSPSADHLLQKLLEGPFASRAACFEDIWLPPSDTIVECDYISVHRLSVSDPFVAGDDIVLSSSPLTAHLLDVDDGISFDDTVYGLDWHDSSDLLGSAAWPSGAHTGILGAWAVPIRFPAAVPFGIYASAMDFLVTFLALAGALVAALASTIWSFQPSGVYTGLRGARPVPIRFPADFLFGIYVSAMDFLNWHFAFAGAFVLALASTSGILFKHLLAIFFHRLYGLALLVSGSRSIVIVGTRRVARAWRRGARRALGGFFWTIGFATCWTGKAVGAIAHRAFRALATSAPMVLHALRALLIWLTAAVRMLLDGIVHLLCATCMVGAALAFCAWASFHHHFFNVVALVGAALWALSFLYHHARL